MQYRIALQHCSPYQFLSNKERANINLAMSSESTAYVSKSLSHFMATSSPTRPSLTLICLCTIALLSALASRRMGDICTFVNVAF